MKLDYFSTCTSRNGLCVVYEAATKLRPEVGQERRVFARLAQKINAFPSKRMGRTRKNRRNETRHLEGTGERVPSPAIALSRLKQTRAQQMTSESQQIVYCTRCQDKKAFAFSSVSFVAARQSWWRGIKETVGSRPHGFKCKVGSGRGQIHHLN